MSGWKKTIKVKGLRKSFKDIEVLKGVDVEVKRGEIFALLGSNCAGKTTIVRILTTLLKQDGGTATVNGSDVASIPENVRHAISLTGQFAAVDKILTGLLPGILLIAIASSISYTAYRLFMDKQRGIIERFHSMPIARSAVLWGHVLTSLVSNAISLVVIILVALIMGFRSSAGVLPWLAVTGILVLFTLALTWVAAIAGLSAKSVEGASALSYPLIYLPFISSAFVPTDSMPKVVRRLSICGSRIQTESSLMFAGIKIMIVVNKKIK